MQPLLLITHPDGLAHDTGAGHPESSDRLYAILRALRDPPFDTITRAEAPLAQIADLRLAHSDDHIMAVEGTVPDHGFTAIGGDTVLCPASYQAALRAAGAAVMGVEEVMASRAKRAFALMRPPGHHAGRDRIAGFCLFNNIAIAALVARARLNAKRVAIVDFDVHHGDGTQDIVWNQADIFFSSLHQEGIYPHTGRADERGGFDNILNIPLPAGTTGPDFIARLRGDILPRLTTFKPDLILTSAGFDAHVLDPIGGMALQTSDYAEIMRILCDAADTLCDGRLVAILEGGYNLTALAESAQACISVMADMPSKQ